MKNEKLFTLPGYQRQLTRYQSAVKPFQVLIDTLADMKLNPDISTLSNLVNGDTTLIQEQIAQKSLKATLHLKDAAEARSIQIQRIQYDDMLRSGNAIIEFRKSETDCYSEPLKIEEAFTMTGTQIQLKPEFEKSLMDTNSVPANATTRKALALCNKAIKAIDELNAFAIANGAANGLALMPLTTEKLSELKGLCLSEGFYNSESSHSQVFAFLPVEARSLHELNNSCFNTQRNDFIKIQLSSGALIGLDTDNKVQIFPENFIHLKNQKNEN